MTIKMLYGSVYPPSRHQQTTREPSPGSGDLMAGVLSVRRIVYTTSYVDIAILSALKGNTSIKPTA